MGPGGTGWDRVGPGGTGWDRGGQGGTGWDRVGLWVYGSTHHSQDRGLLDADEEIKNTFWELRGRVYRV